MLALLHAQVDAGLRDWVHESLFAPSIPYHQARVLFVQHVLPVGYSVSATKAFRDFRKSTMSMEDFLRDFERLADFAGKDLDDIESYQQLLASVDQDFALRLKMAFNNSAVSDTTGSAPFNYSWSWARRALLNLQSIADIEALWPTSSSSKVKLAPEIKQGMEGESNC